MKKKVYELTIDMLDELSGIDSISLVDDPAIDVPFLAFSKDNTKHKINFEVTNEEKRLATGPAMIPDLLIPRRDSKGEIYDVYFSAETIRMIAEKYLMNGENVKNDVGHDGMRRKSIYLLESWIKESEFDKSMQYEQYKDLPLGTWFVTMKVNDDDTWEKVKAGELRGFSVSGWFAEDLVEMTKEKQFLEDFENLLKDIKGLI